MTPLYVLREMHSEDIAHVLEIDRVSFPIPWSERTYKFEITNRETSHMVVLEQQTTKNSPNAGVRGFLQRLLGHNAANRVIVGYGGCWLIAGEAHISTIAVAPDHRGHGLGELLLAGMLQRTINLGAEYSVLEVRESNTRAKALYEKYEYKVIGRRKGYYRDNNEDAYLMEVRPLDTGYRQRFIERVKALHRRVKYQDNFSNPN